MVTPVSNKTINRIPGNKSMPQLKKLSLITSFEFGRDNLAPAITKLFNKDTAFQRLNNFVRHSDNQPVSYLNLISIMDSSEIDSITQISLDKIESIRDELASCFPENQPSFLDSASQFEMNGWLTDNIVHRVDRVSMASSIDAM